MSMTIVTPSPSSSQSQLSIKSKSSAPVSARSNCTSTPRGKKSKSKKPKVPLESETAVIPKNEGPQSARKVQIRNPEDKMDMGQCGDSMDTVTIPLGASLCEASEPKPPFEALPLLKQRLGFFWEKKMYTDVVFKVGPEEFPIEAHRMILASASEMFQQLLFDAKPLITDEKFVLYEPDFSVPAFQAFIKAFYTNEIPICLTLPMALEVFYATKKYSVGFLQDQVLNHILTAVSIPNVFEALRVSTKMIELTFMIPICWNIIEGQTKEVLEYHLDTLDTQTLARILERDQLNLEEFELFQFLVKWGASMCKQNGIKTTGKNKRHFMDPLLKHIRFTTMSTLEFNDVVSPSRILDPKEIHTVLTHQNKSDSKLSIPYKTQIRLKPLATPRGFDGFSGRGEMTNKLSMAASDSIVITRMNGSSKNSSKRSNASKFRSKRGSAQTPR